MHDSSSANRTPRTIPSSKPLSETPCTPHPVRPSPIPQQPRYSHPYGIQSTSSGVLSSSRGTSSPNKVISTHSYQQHTSSQSINKSLLRNSTSVDDLASHTSRMTSNSDHLKPEDKENFIIAGGGKYDSVRTRKRTLAQRSSMSDLSSTINTHGRPAESGGGGGGEWEFKIMASPRNKVAEMRELLMHGGNSNLSARKDGITLGTSGREEEGSIAWYKELLTNLPRNPEEWTSKPTSNRHTPHRESPSRRITRLPKSLLFILCFFLAAELATFICISLSHDTPHEIRVSVSSPAMGSFGSTISSSLPTVTGKTKDQSHPQQQHQQQTFKRSNSRLPLAVVDDIKRWIFRKRVDGKAFLKGADSDWWPVEQDAPPFLPILMAMSRTLHRDLYGRDPHGSTRRQWTLGSQLTVNDQDERHDVAGLQPSNDTPLSDTEERRSGELDLPSAAGTSMNSSSHVCRVVDQFDGRLFDNPGTSSVDRHCNQNACDEEDTNDPFLCQPLFGSIDKPRTTSISSSRSTLDSVISALSPSSDIDTDNDDDACGNHNVRRHAAYFEQGHVGHAMVRQRVGEKEGRVLDHPPSQLSEDDERHPLHDCRLDSPTGRGGMVQAEVEEGDQDVFGDVGKTIKPRKSPRASLVFTPHLAMTQAQEVHTTPPKASSFFNGPVASRPRTSDTVDNRSAPLRKGAGTGHDNKVGYSKDTSDSVISPPAASTDSNKAIRPDLALVDTVVLDAPAHMYRMAQHEKAGLRPYGALCRAYTSPVPSNASPVGNRQRGGGGEFPRLPTMGMVSAFPPMDGPLAPGRGLADDDSQSSGLRKQCGDTLDLFNFEPPCDSPCRPADSKEVDSATSMLQDTTKRLGLAEARIRELERVVAEVVEEQKRMPLAHIAPASNQQEAARVEDSNTGSNKADEPIANAGDKIKVAIADLLAWLSGGGTTPSFSLSPSSATSTSTSTPIHFTAPANLRQIPGYVFLVGVGLSVIVVRTVFSSPYSRSNK